MNFQNLEYFLAVAEEQSITKAAERIGLTQQALSGQILRLEEEMGCPLFDRKPSFVLNYAGECFREQAQQMLNLKYQSESMLKDIRANEKGQLRIGISYSRGQAILPMVLPEYAQSHPKVELSIVEDTPQVLIEKTVQGKLDVVIDFLPFQSVMLKAIPLFKEHLFVVASRELLDAFFGGDTDHVLAELADTGNPSLLKAVPFILLRTGEHLRTMIDHEFRMQGFAPIIRIETSNARTALALAMEGMGVTIAHEVFLTSGFIAGDFSERSADGRLAAVPLKQGSLVDTIGIGYHKDRYLPIITRDFVELCQQKLRSLSRLS